MRRCWLLSAAVTLLHVSGKHYVTVFVHCSVAPGSIAKTMEPHKCLGTSAVASLA